MVREGALVGDEEARRSLISPGEAGDGLLDVPVVAHGGLHPSYHQGHVLIGEDKV